MGNRHLTLISLIQDTVNAYREYANVHSSTKITGSDLPNLINNLSNTKIYQNGIALPFSFPGLIFYYKNNNIIKTEIRGIDLFPSILYGFNLRQDQTTLQPLPSSVQTIEPQSFAYLSQDIILPEGVTTIKNYAFYDWQETSLKIILPSTVTNIETDSFFRSSWPSNFKGSLTFYCKGTTPPILSGPFTNYDSRANLQIYVPYSEDHSILTAYQNATNWSQYNIEEWQEPILSSFSSLNTYFNNLSNSLKNKFGYSTVRADDFDRSFYDDIAQIYIDNSTSLLQQLNFINFKTIPQQLCQYWNPIQNFGNIILDFSSSPALTSIGANAFYGASLTNRIIIPSTVTSIGDQAFITNTATMINGINKPSLGLTEVHMLSTIPPVLQSTYVFSMATNGKIYVPYSSDHSILTAYKKAINWQDYLTYLVEEPES